jgi:hypothetical protein
MIKPINDARYNFKVVRVAFRYSTFKKILKILPMEKDESASDYFERLSKYLAEKL